MKSYIVDEFLGYISIKSKDQGEWLWTSNKIVWEDLSPNRVTKYEPFNSEKIKPSSNKIARKCGIR